jgi:hypothetical protein
MLTCLISEFAALERRLGSVRHERVEHLPHGRIDVSILNPAAMLTMAHRGTGVFDSPKNVAAVAVASRLGFTSLADIATKRYPLRVSVRGSIDACTPIMVDVVLRARVHPCGHRGLERRDQLLPADAQRPVTPGPA